MEIQTWLAFVSATFVLSAIPGPSVLVVTGQAIANGRRSALICILGELLGGVCLMAISLLGVGVALAASPFAFQALKWFGVAFLLYMGLNALGFAKRPVAGGERVANSFGAGFLTSVLNPKSLVFYLAFLSQFVNISALLWPQYIILVLTAASVAGLVLGGYAMLAARLRQHISSASAQKKASGITGLFYIAGAAYVATTR